MLSRLIEHPEDLVAILQLLTAVTLVSIDALSRYNTPPSLRSETTWGKFVLGRSAYLGVILSVFTVLIVSPQAFVGLIRSMNEQGAVASWLDGLQKSLSFPLIVALFMTVLLAEIPGLSKLDRALRSYLQWISAIPRERRTIISCIRHSHLTPGEETCRAQLSRLASEGVPVDVSQLADGESVEHRLVKAGILLQRLQRLESLPKYMDHLFHSDDYRGLKDGLAQRVTKAALFRELAIAGSSSRAIDLYRKELDQDVERFVNTLYDFVSRLVLNAERTDRGRRDCIGALGLEPLPRREPLLSLDEFLWLNIFLALFLALARPLDPITAVITINHALATLIGLGVASMAREVFDESEVRHRPLPPIGYHLFAGLCALLVAWCVGIGYRVVHDGEVLALLKGQADRSLGDFFSDGRWAWGLMSFATAATIAALAGDWVESRVRAVRGRLQVGKVVNMFDGLVLAVILGVVAVVVRELLGQDASWVQILRSAGIGAIIGCWVPTLYRVRRERTAGPPESVPVETALSGSLASTG